MNLAEVDKTLSTMVVLYDTREQDTPRRRARLAQIEQYCPTARALLNYGDYSARVTIDGEPKQLPVAIERKMNLDELCQCFTSARKRFTREFERMRQQSGKMYLLIENANWDDVYQHRYRSQMTANSLIASIDTWAARYGCPVVMCGERLTGKRIYHILHYEAREWLQNMAE